MCFYFYLFILSGLQASLGSNLTLFCVVCPKYFLGCDNCMCEIMASGLNLILFLIMNWEEEIQCDPGKRRLIEY